MSEPVLEEAAEAIDYGKAILSVSKDRREIVFELAGKEYTGTKPKKVEEWFVQLQLAMSSEDTGKLIYEADRFLGKILGPEQYKELQARRLDDDDDLTFNEMIESMYDLFEIWTTEEDQPIRPTGPRSVSGRGRKRTTRK